jgi:hypothetical protein
VQGHIKKVLSKDFFRDGVLMRKLGTSGENSSDRSNDPDMKEWFEPYTVGLQKA